MVRWSSCRRRCSASWLALPWKCLLFFSLRSPGCLDRESACVRAEPAVAADGAGITAFRAMKSLQPAPLLNGVVLSQEKLCAMIEVPSHFLAVSYNGDCYPGAPGVSGIVQGANCQQFAY